MASGLCKSQTPPCLLPDRGNRCGDPCSGGEIIPEQFHGIVPHHSPLPHALRPAASEDQRTTKPPSRSIEARRIRGNLRWRHIDGVQNVGECSTTCGVRRLVVLMLSRRSNLRSVSIPSLHSCVYSMLITMCSACEDEVGMSHKRATLCSVTQRTL